MQLHAIVTERASVALASAFQRTVSAMKSIWVLLIAALLQGCTGIWAERWPVDQQIAAAMIGDFETDPANGGNQFLDRRRALPPLGDGLWIYLQLNSGPDQTLYRQRVLQLVDHGARGVVQNTFSLASPDDKRDLIADPARLAALTLADLKPTLEKGCDFAWHPAARSSGFLWRGEVSPEDCVIFSKRRQQRIRIGAESLLRDDALWQAERGFDLEGNFLWGSSEGDFTQLTKVR